MASAIYAPEKVEKVEKVEKGFREEIERLLKDSFSTEEVEAAKSAVLQYNKQRRAEDNQLAGTLRNYLFLNPTLAFQENLDKQIAALNAEQVNAAMRKHITPDKISVFKARDFAKAKAKAAEATKPQ